jgi:2-polyprenyl-3-methyl-5-hydroxy-6-metoxy-1,4-benzoquinol methylase
MSETKLGDWEKYTKEEREAKYRGLGSSPSSTDRGLALPRTQWLIHHDKLRRMERVLECGCHDGFLTRWLLQSHFCELLVGVEICEAAYQLAVDQANEEGSVNAACFYYNLSWDEFDQPTKFSDVIMAEFLEHLSPKECHNLVQTSHEYLRPGGRGFITTPHIDGVWGRSNPDPHHINLMNELQVSVLVKEAIGITPDVKTAGDFIYAIWKKA